MNDGAYNYFSSLVLQFLGWISSLIYGMVSLVTQGFFNLSYIQIFKSDVVEQITARLYVVLAVFMIFKLAFSLIQYLVNPDQVNDKQAGMGKMVSRTATAFIMLIGVPIIFTEFVFGPEGASPDHTYQAIIARSIPRIILGSNVDTSNSDVGRSMGETMAATAFSAFVQPREGCNAPSLTTATISDIADATYARCSDVVDGGESSIFAYDYNWLFGLAVGLLMLVIMLFFTVDIAIRAIKLGILRIIAPIPIISYVDPKSAKDGAFNNWLKSLISTFLELFIKVAVIYIIIFIINELTSAGGGFFDNAGLDAGEQMYATVFIIIGMLLFAMQASAFIKNIFGIKDQGLGTGLGMLMGGAGALLAGGGIAGMAKGMMQGASDGAQGKASFGNFNKGKELAAKTAKGKAHAQKKELARNKKLAEKFGLDERYEKAEEAASALESQAAMAEAKASVDGASEQDKINAANLRQQATQARVAADKAKKDKDDPWGAWAKGNTPEGKAKYHATQFAQSVGNAVRHPVQTAKKAGGTFKADYDLYRNTGSGRGDAFNNAVDDAITRRAQAYQSSELNRQNAKSQNINTAAAQAEFNKNNGFGGLPDNLGGPSGSGSGGPGGPGTGGTP